MFRASQNRTRLILAALTVAAALPGAAHAQEIEFPDISQVIIPQARSFPLRPDIGPVQITGIEVRAVIREQTARTALEVSLQNPASRQQEAVLLLPVPDGAVVSSMRFEGAASEPTARLLPRDEARRTYDSIVRKVRDPALLEFAGYSLIRSSVFPVPAQGTQKVRVVYEHVLEGDGNRLDYVLPRSESLERRVPWTVTVQLESEHPVSTVYSPSHEVDVQRVSSSKLAVQLAAAARLEPGPFRLSYLLEREGVTASMFAYPDPSVGGGYFLFVAGLPATIDPATTNIKREVTVVIDRSGSMAGPKMDQVKAAALQVIEGLADGEAFNIIDYATSVSTFAAQPVVKSNETSLEARAYLDAIRPSGGTNIHDALVEALRQECTDGHMPIVLFLTDGLPTIGRTSELAIREMVEQGNPHTRRIFTFGVGEDVNVPLLDRVAELTRATSTYVLPEEDVELKVATVFRRLYGPVFSAPALATTDTAGQESTRLVHEQIPEDLPDLFDGDSLIVLGQYRGEEAVTFKLSGEYLGDERSFTFTFDLASATTRNAFVPRLWASRRIAYLIDQIRQAGATTQPAVVGTSMLADPRYDELIEEILRLSTKFGILTEYTSFLATEGTDLSNWDELKVGCSTTIDHKAVRTRSGRGALSQSLNFTQQKGQAWLNYGNTFVDENLSKVATNTVQQMNDRAFFKRGNRWVDSRLIEADPNGTPDQTMAYGSEEHLELLRRLITEGRQGVLSMSGEILLDIDGRSILVTNETSE
jgi:Ca-activated chloride channel family protein